MKTNKQYCKAIPKAAQKYIIKECKKLCGNDFVQYVKDLPPEDESFIEKAEV